MHIDEAVARYASELPEQLRKMLNDSAVVDLITPVFRFFRDETIGWSITTTTGIVISTVGPDEDNPRAESLDYIMAMLNIRQFVAGSFFIQAQKNRLPDPALDNDRFNKMGLFYRRDVEEQRVTKTSDDAYVVLVEDIARALRLENIGFYNVMSDFVHAHANSLTQRTLGMYAEQLTEGQRAEITPEVYREWSEELTHHALYIYALFTPQEFPKIDIPFADDVKRS